MAANALVALLAAALVLSSTVVPGARAEGTDGGAKSQATAIEEDETGMPGDVAGGHPDTRQKPSHVLELTLAEFQKPDTGSQDMLVEFYSAKCEACKEFEAEYEEVAKALSNSTVVVAKVDGDAHPELAAHFRVRRYPTLKWVPSGGGAPQDYIGDFSKRPVLWFVYMKTGLLGSVRGFLASYGWLVLGAAILALWLRGALARAYQSYKQSRPEDVGRVQELERRREAARRRQQEAAEEAKGQWLVDSAAKEEEQRRKRVEELDSKAARYGLRPRGTGHRLGT